VSTIRLSHPSGSRAELRQHGAHITSFVDPAGRELLYLSRRAHFEAGKSIRGGIPIVFPQFADTGPLPNHGFLRTRAWDVAQHDGSNVTLVTREDAGTLALWPHRFRAELAVRLNESIEMQLTITNTSSPAFTFTAAFHTYFAVTSIADARIVGLRGRAYRDKVRDYAKVVDISPAVSIEERTDRVYERAPDTLTLDQERGHAVLVQSTGFGDWVVWNPWKNHGLTDMEPQDYERFVCVEAARIADPVTLASGERWTAAQVVGSR
jgi:glucose-6-phosphate 1-epimerase